jgi:hypothetical protein
MSSPLPIWLPFSSLISLHHLTSVSGCYLSNVLSFSTFVFLSLPLWFFYFLHFSLSLMVFRLCWLANCFLVYLSPHLSLPFVWLTCLVVKTLSSRRLSDWLLFCCFVVYVIVLKRLRAYSHLPCLVRTKPKKSLVQTFWAGVNTNNQTLVRTKQPVWDPAGEVVSIRFQMNPGAVRLRCERDRARSDPVQKIKCLFGYNRLPLLLVYVYCLISTVNSKINLTLSDRHHVIEPVKNQSWLNMERRGDNMSFGYLGRRHR